MTIAAIGMGTKVAFGNGASPQVFTNVAEVLTLNPPSDNIAVIDVTNMDSEDFTQEFIQGLNDPGDFSFTFNWLPGGTADATIQAWRAARGPKDVRITWPNAYTWTFTILLTGYTPSTPMDDKMTAEVTGKVTSSYVSAPGS